MINNYKIFVVTPAGRQRYLKILASYILAEKIIDQWQLWVNTTKNEDIAFIENLKSKYKSKIKLIYPESNVVKGNLTIGNFFKNCLNENTIYIRMDDDIVYIENNFFKKLIEERIKNKKPLLIFPVIINNAIISHLLQENKLLKLKKLYLKATAMDEIGWENPKFAYYLHKKFINAINNNKIKNFYIKSAYISLNRFSINCFVFFGKDFRKFKGEIFGDEEEYLTVNLPYKLNRFNYIYGNVICSHFSFWPQEEYLKKTNIYDEYYKIAKKDIKRKKIIENLEKIKINLPKLKNKKDIFFSLINGIFKKKYPYIDIDYGYKIYQKIRNRFYNFKDI